MWKACAARAAVELAPEAASPCAAAAAGRAMDAFRAVFRTLLEWKWERWGGPILWLSGLRNASDGGGGRVGGEEEVMGGGRMEYS